MLSTPIQGFLVMGGLIVAIGAQNAFVLKQGLLKQHVFWVCLVCFLCDFALSSLGVLGLGSLFAKNAILSMAFSVFGAVFLLGYGFRAFRGALQGNAGLSTDNPSQATLKTTLLTTLGLTLLNPHVYLDTVILMGSISSPLTPTQKPLFLLGAMMASASWFFGLGYGARLLRPLFAKPQTWQILDGIIGVVMWTIAFGLFRYAYQLWV